MIFAKHCILLVFTFYTAFKLFQNCHRTNGRALAVKYLFLLFLLCLLTGCGMHLQDSVWLSLSSPSPRCSHLCVSVFLSGLSRGRPILNEKHVLRWPARHAKNFMKLWHKQKNDQFSNTHISHSEWYVPYSHTMKFNQIEQTTCCKCTRGIMFLFPSLSSGECSGCQRAVTGRHSRVIVAVQIQGVGNTTATVRGNDPNTKQKC